MRHLPVVAGVFGFFFLCISASAYAAEQCKSRLITLGVNGSQASLTRTTPHGSLEFKVERVGNSALRMSFNRDGREMANTPQEKWPSEAKACLSQITHEIRFLKTEAEFECRTVLIGCTNRVCTAFACCEIVGNPDSFQCAFGRSYY
jgi:hypothetical protein